MRKIDADVLIYAIEKRIDDITDESFAEGMFEAITEIEFQPTIEERETALDWHDIYDDLPDEPGEYLLTVEGRQSGRRWVDQVYFNGTSFDHYYLAKPIAWAEMPEPYQR